MREEDIAPLKPEFRLKFVKRNCARAIFDGCTPNMHGFNALLIRELQETTVIRAELCFSLNEPVLVVLPSLDANVVADTPCGRKERTQVELPCLWLGPENQPFLRNQSVVEEYGLAKLLARGT